MRTADSDAPVPIRTHTTEVVSDVAALQPTPFGRPTVDNVGVTPGAGADAATYEIDGKPLN